MVEAHAQVGGHMLATMEVPRAATSNYGDLDVTHESGPLANVRVLVEKPCADVASVGVTGLSFQGERFDCGSIQGFVQATTAYAPIYAPIRPELRDDYAHFLVARRAPLELVA